MSDNKVEASAEEKVQAATKESVTAGNSIRTAKKKMLLNYSASSPA